MQEAGRGAGWQPPWAHAGRGTGRGERRLPPLPGGVCPTLSPLTLSSCHVFWSTSQVRNGSLGEIICSRGAQFSVASPVLCL